MTFTETSQAVDFFRQKLEFTTGPVGVSRMVQEHENVNIVDVRAPV